MSIAQAKAYLLLALAELSDPVTPPVEPPPPPPTPPRFDYSKYAQLSPLEIQTWAFPNGLPAGWDWGKWAEASGKPDPRQITRIETSAPFTNPDFIVDRGEMDLHPGQTKTVTCTTRAIISWVAHAPQYRGPCDVFVGAEKYQGAYSVAEVDPGSHHITYSVGPSQGLRVAVNPR